VWLRRAPHGGGGGGGGGGGVFAGEECITSQSCACSIVCDVSSCVSFVSRPGRLDGWKNELFLLLVVGEMSYDTVRSITGASDYLCRITNRKVGVIPDMAIITLLLVILNFVRLVIGRSLVSLNISWMSQNTLITTVR